MLVSKTNERNTIYTLQFLRCIAFIVVFLSHIGFSQFSYVGRSGVSVFLVMSGFLMTYNYYENDKIQSITIKDNLLFAINKIKKLYPLHIVLMLFFAIILFWIDKTESTKEIIVKLLLNSLLIQEWFPIARASLNGVSWYLCTYIFACLLFPWINRYMEKKYNKRKAVIWIFVSLIVQCIFGLVGNKLQTFSIVGKGWIIDNIEHWFVYFFPLSHFWDFFIGCNLAYIFMHKEHDLYEWKYTLLEFLSIIFATLTNIISYQVGKIYFIWWNDIIIFSLSTIILVYVFAIGKGKISNLLTNKFTLYFAKISPYAFLIHYGVFKFNDEIVHHLTNSNGDLFLLEYYKWINLTFGAILTIILCEIWIKITEKFNLKKRQIVGF